MNKYIVAAELDELIAEAERLSSGTFGSTPQLIDVWFARAHDALAVFLPTDSGLRSTLKAAYEEYTTQKLTQLPSRAVTILRRASDLNRIRRDADLSTEIRQEMQAVIAETYAKSWAFRATLAGLLATIGFAIFGIVQLNTLRIDVRDRAEAAAKKAEQEIEEQKTRSTKAIATVASDAQQAVERQLRADLQAHVETTKRDITSAAQAHIDELRRQKAPEIESALVISRMRMESLQKKLQASEATVAELEHRIGVLNRGIDQMRRSVTGSSLLERLNAFLDRSRGYVAGELLALTIAFLLSAYAAFTAFRRRST